MPTTRRTTTLGAAKRRARAKEREDVLPLPRNKRAPPVFRYVHYETAWDFDPDLGFLPELSRIDATPGANGVGENGDLSKTLAGVAAKGGTDIDPYDKRLLLKGEDPAKPDATFEFYDYVRYFECTDGRRYYVDPGCAPTVNMRGAIVWDKEYGRNWNRQFRKHIRDAGMIPPLHYTQYEVMRQLQMKTIRNLEARVGKNPHLVPRLEAARTKLTGMEAAWDKLIKTDAAQDRPEAIKPRTLKPRRSKPEAS